MNELPSLNRADPNLTVKAAEPISPQVCREKSLGGACLSTNLPLVVWLEGEVVEVL